MTTTQVPSPTPGAPAPRTNSAARRAAAGSPRSGGQVIGTWGLLALTILVIIVFSALKPSSFPTLFNLRSILANQSIPAVLALGATVPIVTGRFDLSIGYGIGLSSVLAMWLIAEHHVAWPLACALVVVAGLFVGIVNGLLVELAQIDSFIATLGTGSVLYAITYYITGGGRIVAVSPLPTGFTDIVNSQVLGVPVAFWYVVIVALILWLVLEHLPAGRYLYVVGANPRAAQLVGIPRTKVVLGAFAASGLITGFAGVLLASQQQIGDPSAGSSYLLPAFVGALLGSTAIKPGRANAVGTIVAVTILAVGLSGISQFASQAAGWAIPLFNGLTLLAAVGLAGFAARRRLRAGTVIGAAGRPPSSTSSTSSTTSPPAEPETPPTGPMNLSTTKES
jgi:ribose transport system permease protein